MATAALNLSGKAIGTILRVVRAIIAAMTGNLNFVDPVPKLETITVKADDLDVKNQLARKGSEKQKLEAKVARGSLMTDMKSLIGYVQSASGGDELKIMSAAVDIKKPRTATGILSFPLKFRGTYGETEGSIILRWGGVKRKKNYEVKINDTPGDDTKWKLLVITGKNQFTLEGLISGKEYAFMIATRSTAGLGAWSDPVLQRAR